MNKYPKTWQFWCLSFTTLAFLYFLQVVYTLRGRILYKFLQVIPLWAYIFTSSSHSLHFPPYALQVLFFEEIKGEIVKSHLFEMWLNFFILCISYQGGVWLSSFYKGFTIKGEYWSFVQGGELFFTFKYFISTTYWLITC